MIKVKIKQIKLIRCSAVIFCYRNDLCNPNLGQVPQNSLWNRVSYWGPTSQSGRAVCDRKSANQLEACQLENADWSVAHCTIWHGILDFDVRLQKSIRTQWPGYRLTSLNSAFEAFLVIFEVRRYEGIQRTVMKMHHPDFSALATITGNFPRVSWYDRST